MKKKKLTALVSCMLLCTNFATLANAEEAEKTEKVDDATVLDEVVVTGSKLNPLKIPVKITVITEAEIKAKGAQTVAEALEDVAGLYMTSSNVKGKATAQFRGSDSNSTKVIIDGVLISTIGDGRVDLQVIPTDNIEKIEVIKGAAPVKFGTDAPGGIIYITTKNGSKDSNSVSVTRGSYDTERVSASFGGDSKNFNYYFGLKSEDTDGYTNHTAKSSDFYNGKLRWNLTPQSSLTVFGSYSDTTEQLPNRIDANGNILNYPGSGGTLTSRNNYFGGGGGTGNTYNWAYEPIKQSYIGAVYDRKLNNTNDITFKLYRSTLKSLLTTESTNPAYGYQFVDWDGTIKGYELQHTIRTSGSNAATWGYSYETRNFVELTPYDSNGDGIPDGPYNRGDYNYTGKSFYVQDALTVNSRLGASLGYRHNEIDDGIIINTRAYTPNYQNIQGKYSSDDPVFNLNYKLSEATAVHGSFGKSYRAPNAMERSAPGGVYAPLGITTASPYVLPEEAINREIGLSSSTKSGLEFDITYFSKDITNMIKGGGGGGGRTQYYNIPSVEMHGFEMEVSQKVSERFKAFANYSYTNAYDTRVNMQVSDIPYRKFSYGLNYADKNGISANLAVTYVGAVRSMYSQGNGNGSSDGNATVDYVNSWMSKDLPAYHVVDLKVSKTIKSTEYYVKVQNLFDKLYYQGAYLAAPGRYTELGTTVRF